MARDDSEGTASNFFFEVKPCPEWADRLLLRPEDFDADEWLRFNAHLASCSACRTAREEFFQIVEHVQSLPAPSVKPFPRLGLWHNEHRDRDAWLDHLRIPHQRFSTASDTERSPLQKRRTLILAVITVLLVISLLIASFLLLRTARGLVGG